ncbi:hypothetical protein SAMN06265365_116101 [Tistlia consotensis]|uniref:Uncharacterized protein n=1 Tax=Tistlia consotensis USBA 355 TaxID=560819 RepID=A0A1Y6CE81_9PROT|nr:hypothetical protein [Tistlia consotensis]SMF48032.1 hypothetical protein SAMN05428998_11736 [Tistlia consotensis USBA 355]SNR81956.1 hypothetical protein SAMN06265365_116101 [Tistlia consotensis]
MSFTLTIDLVNNSGDKLQKSAQTQGDFTTQPPDTLAGNGSGQAVATGGGEFIVEIWYGHGQTEPQGIGISVSGQQVSPTGTSCAAFKIDSQSENAATVTVTFVPVGQRVPLGVVEPAS